MAAQSSKAPGRILTNKKTGQTRTQTPYEYGYQAENNCRKSLRSAGYHVIRAAASQGIFDIIGFHSTGRDCVAVQVKRGERPSPCDYKSAVELPVPAGILKLVIWYPAGMGAARILYCADNTGLVPVPDWCAGVRWFAGLPPKQQTLRGL